MAAQESLEVTHNHAANRFEILIDSHLAVLDYHLEDQVITFTHTGVPAALGGRGLGSQLVRAGLDYAREKQLFVVPLCSFVSSYIQKKPEYQDLLRPDAG